MQRDMTRYNVVFLYTTPNNPHKHTCRVNATPRSGGDWHRPRRGECQLASGAGTFKKIGTSWRQLTPCKQGGGNYSFRKHNHLYKYRYKYLYRYPYRYLYAYLYQGVCQGLSTDVHPCFLRQSLVFNVNHGCLQWPF